MEGTLTIVLSYEANPDGSISEECKRRVEAAVRLFESRSTDRILMSGRCTPGREEGLKETEAETMRQYAIKLGVPASAIMVEEKAMDTVGNAMYTRGMVDGLPEVRRIIVVTSDYHVERTRYLFVKAFGSARPISFIGAYIDMSKEDRDALEQKEREKVEKMRELYGKIVDGDYPSFRKEVLAHHNLYKKRVSRSS
jgi:uncharacterized SAM-binding protein YcdF (DUF218 family)